jgi:ABC-2 type transport system permease protein
MKPYLSLLRCRFLNGIQYRAAALAGLTTQFFWGIMLIFIFRAFYGDADSSGGFLYKDLVSYIWLQQAFLAFLFFYDWDGELIESIRTGGISYELCRPVNIYQIWYVKLLSKRLAMGTMRFSPVIIIALLLPQPYGLSLPHSFLSFLVFVVTLFLGLFLVVAIVMLIYVSIFKTMSPAGSIGLLMVIGDFFGGFAIPIPLMPGWLQTLCNFMPFRWAADLPLRVYSGSIGLSEGIFGLFVQIFWIIILTSSGALIMKRITRLTFMQGG